VGKFMKPKIFKATKKDIEKEVTLLKDNFKEVSFSFDGEKDYFNINVKNFLHLSTEIKAKALQELFDIRYKYNNVGLMIHPCESL
jgi:hypothetical protein